MVGYGGCGKGSGEEEEIVGGGVGVKCKLDPLGRREFKIIRIGSHLLSFWPTIEVQNGV